MDTASRYDNCPFVGLRPFGYNERDVFFGRDDQIAGLERLVARSKLISVIGSSGSGKSSLIRAGLLPRLIEGTAESRWSWVAMRPGDSPIRSLAEALARADRMLDGAPIDPVVEGRTNRIELVLRESSFGIRDALPFVNVADRQLVILIDQFEEIFRFADLRSQLTLENIRADEQRDEATLFIQLILNAADDDDFSGRIIITMRSDFIGDCARFHGLTKAVTNSQYLVPALNREQRAEVVRMPVERRGGVIEPLLVQRVLNDTNEDPDQLPVLQHALMRTWQHAAAANPNSAPLLRLHDYTDIGGIKDSISIHAEEILAALDKAEPVSPAPYFSYEYVTKRIFQSLTDTDSLGRTIRRPQKLGQLAAVLADDDASAEERALAHRAVREVVQRFIGPECSFLRLNEGDVIDDTTVVDIGHEALIRCWSKLGAVNERNWVREEQADGEELSDLVTLAENRVTLLPNQIAAKEDWWAQRRPNRFWVKRYARDADWLGQAQSVLRESRAVIERDRTLQRYRRVTRWALAIAVAIVVIGFGVREHQHNIAAQEDRIAAQEDRYVRLGTLLVVDGNADLGLLTALQATERVKLPIAAPMEGLIYAGLERLYKTVEIENLDRPFSSIAFAHDGNLLVYAHGVLSEWDSDTGERLPGKDIPIKSKSSFYDMKLSNDGTKVALGGTDHTFIVDLVHRKARELGEKDIPDLHAGLAAFSPDATMLVTASRNASPKIWQAKKATNEGDDSDYRVLVDLSKIAPNLQTGSSVAFGNHLIAVGNSDGVISLYRYDAKANSFAFWRNLEYGGAVRSFPGYPCSGGGDMSGRSSQIDRLEFNPTNPDILLIMRSGEAVLWNLNQGEGFRLPYQCTNYFRGTFSRDGKSLTLASTTGVVDVWDLRQVDWKALAIHRKPITLSGILGFVGAVTFRGDYPDRVAASGNGKIEIWALKPALQWSAGVADDPPTANEPKIDPITGGNKVHMSSDMVRTLMHLPDGYRTEGRPISALSQDGRWLAVALAYSQPIGAKQRITTGKLQLYDLSVSSLIASFDLPIVTVDSHAAIWRGVRFASKPDRVVVTLSSGDVIAWRYFGQDGELLAFVHEALPHINGSTVDIGILCRFEEQLARGNPALDNTSSESDRACNQPR